MITSTEIKVSVTRDLFDGGLLARIQNGAAEDCDGRFGVVMCSGAQLLRAQLTVLKLAVWASSISFYGSSLFRDALPSHVTSRLYRKSSLIHDVKHT